MVEGCTDETAFNYNPDANTDNDSCIAVIEGCIDITACNYNPSANTSNDSCEYPETYYNCDGNCLIDSDGDGVCDELEVFGCTDSEAFNYDSDATEDDGSCYLSPFGPDPDNSDCNATILLNPNPPTDALLL